MRRIGFILFLLLAAAAQAQQRYHGTVTNQQNGEPVAGATIRSSDSSITVMSDANGKFSLSTTVPGLTVSASGFQTQPFFPSGSGHQLVVLVPVQKELDAVVVSGTLRPVKKLESPVPVEVYTPQFLKKNPTPSLFESLQNVNGVRPQLNCSVCNTGDIHINGLEGPYTMITIDGMPIVSSLASVYGLFGIPTQLIERVEIVKGPASGLYGAEAIGGLINIITQSPEKAPLLTANYMLTSWQEHTLDLGAKFRMGKKATLLTGINYFNYQDPIDRNKDQFTDVTLQHRISVFNKFSLARKKQRVATLAGRYFYEDRWGGDLRWNKTFRGSDSIYGESIYTKRWELIGNYQLPISERLFFSFSATGHTQDSWYGTTPYKARQRIGFGQLLWDKQAGTRHQLLTGLAIRHTFYDDNSTATIDTLSRTNRPDRYSIPGIFIQDEWKLATRHLLLLGLRYDHHPVHRSIFTPRLAWKWSLQEGQALRLNAGTGFRVVSLFTEEHAALTGARAVKILETLQPERSYNINLNYTLNQRWKTSLLTVDAALWYSRFSNQIIADYDSDPNAIIYANLDGYSTSKGFTLNLELNKGNRFKSLVGLTLQEVAKTETNAAGQKEKQQPVLTERWSGTWALTYIFPGVGITVDYTGNIYGPMRLPLLSALDPRPATSPVWSIQNIQLSKHVSGNIEFFGGVKNLLNWTPARRTPFIIARSHDPFDKQVEYDASGQVKATAENPYALSFDPSYVYAPNQGIRFFAGIRYKLKK